MSADGAAATGPPRERPAVAPAAPGSIGPSGAPRGAPPEPHDRPGRRPPRNPDGPGRRRSSRTPARLAGPLVLALVLLPALLLALRTARGDLGTDPVETLEHQTGIWALRFLALSLLVTPLRRATGWNWLARHRRTLGLATFAYATTHLLVYLVVDQGLALGYIVEDVAERPWITIGMTTWLLLLPLAVTSTSGWVRRLGGRRWARLHRLVYLCAVGGALHYFLAVKRDVTLPLIYAAVFAALLGWRAAARWTGRRRMGGGAPAD